MFSLFHHYSVDLFKHSLFRIPLQRLGIPYSRNANNNCNDTEMGHYQNNGILFVGLGNIDYPKTRHSVGMKCIDRLADCLKIKLQRKKECAGLIGTATVSGIKIVLLKPKVPMNINGTSVFKTVKYFDINTEDVYLLHDDLEKKVGVVTIKEKGSASGHNGVKSVINSLGSDMIPRLRIGIDRPATKDMVPDYVMENFSAHDQKIINETFFKGIDLLVKHIEQRTGQSIGCNLKSDEEEKMEKCSV